MSTTQRPRELTSRIMRAIRGKDSKAERHFRCALHAAGVRYRKHYKAAAGSPDLVIVWAKIAVFIDGDFWHGNSWKKRGLPTLAAQFPTRTEYWTAKIQRNMKRDRKVDRHLRRSGWTVLHFWESDVLANVDACISKTLRFIAKVRSSLPS